MADATERPGRLPPGTLPEWLHPDDGDTLFGIEAIAGYLALPFLDVRTMIGMDRLPTWKAGRAHTTRRTELARHFLDLERLFVPAGQRAFAPDDLGPADALGLLSGQHAIAAHLGCSHGGVRHRREKLGLSVFWIGKTPFARRASLDRWQEGQRTQTRSTRRLATIQAKRRAQCPDGWLVGAAEIAERLGTTKAAVFMAEYAGRLPIVRIGKAFAADPAALAAANYHPRKKADHHG